MELLEGSKSWCLEVQAFGIDTMESSSLKLSFSTWGPHHQDPSCSGIYCHLLSGIGEFGARLEESYKGKYVYKMAGCLHRSCKP